jgi:DNA-binding GntR family transcriptional regulator
MDVLEVRATLDGLASSLSASHNRREIKELKHVQSQFVNYVEKENLQGSIKKDVEFHDIIYRSSRNDKLIQISNNLREQIQRFRVIYIKDYSSTRELIKEHNEIIDAITTRDPEAAMRSAQTHIKKQEDAITRSVKKNRIIE